MSLRTELEAAGLNVKAVTGWGTRGGAWAMGKPMGIMEHHTSLPVPYPVNGLYGSLLKANINTKPDGTVWLIAQRACNYSSGSGSRVVLNEMLAGRAPTANALERGLVDDMNGNPWFWNQEHDHVGDGRPIPAVQHDAIVATTRVVLDYFDLAPAPPISHAEWTRRKRDPYWNGSLRAIEEIRSALAKEAPRMFLPLEQGTAGDRDEDVRALKGLLNTAYGVGLDPADEDYDAALVAAVKTHLGTVTGHPDWKLGKGVGGLQWAKLLTDVGAKGGGGPVDVDAKIAAHADDPDAHHE